MEQKFTIIGAGNLATHLAIALKKAGASILQVYSRTEYSAKELAQKLDCSFTTSVETLQTNADVFILAVKDSAFEEVLSKFNNKNKLLVHCSGSTPLSAIQGYSENIGVLYPLQTFSKNRDLNFKEIPVFVEANSTVNKNMLMKTAKMISEKVAYLDSEKRLHLHIAAVFACNFVNHFYTIASDILKSSDVPFDVLKPLIMETARKVQELPPSLAQTGPAVRFDENIISKHLTELNGIKNYGQLYNSVSKSIFEHHQKIINGIF